MMRLGDIRPCIVPLGDAALVVRFGTSLDEAANRAALRFAGKLDATAVNGVLEVVPSLVSVLVRYDPQAIGPVRLAGELGLLLEGGEGERQGQSHRIAVRFGGEDGPDCAEVAAALGLDEAGFVARHNQTDLRILATGFAPGFVYCGFHPEPLTLPRRPSVRKAVPPGSVLFAAGQTAIAATEVPTGWHVIGRTEFRNFTPEAMPPTRLMAGDFITFEAQS